MWRRFLDEAPISHSVALATRSAYLDTANTPARLIPSHIWSVCSANSGEHMCRYGRVGFLIQGSAGSVFTWLGAGTSWLPVAGDFGFVNPPWAFRNRNPDYQTTVALVV
jgi:hypothetical protein